MSTEVFRRKIEEIRRVFNVEKMLETAPSLSAIAKYYRGSKLWYSLLHSRMGFTHVGLSKNGVYQGQPDLQEQPKIVAEWVSRTNAETILELGAGRGGNSCYLAKRFPDSRITAIDLPNGHFDIAKKEMRRFRNITAQEGDFHDLSAFPNHSFDLIFAIESLSHSTKKETVFREVRRVLKPSGVFIIIDGYTTHPRETLDRTTALAMRLAERGMMVEEFERYERVLESARRTEFAVVSQEDATSRILPTFRYYKSIAQRFFSAPHFIQKTAVALIPPAFTGNLISAHLLCDITEAGLATYHILVLAPPL